MLLCVVCQTQSAVLFFPFQPSLSPSQNAEINARKCGIYNTLREEITKRTNKLHGKSGALSDGKEERKADRGVVQCYGEEVEN